MKRLLFVLLFCFVTTSGWCATRTISDAGGNWNATTAWVEGAVPVTGDDVVATATSGNLVVNVATASLRSFDLTGYLGTLSGTSNITVRGLTASINVCKFAGTITWTGTLIFSPVSTTAVIQLTTNENLLTKMTVTSGAATSLVVLQDNLSFTAVKTNSITLTTQGLDLNGFTISGNSSINRLLITSVTLGTAVALTVNGGTFANCDFRDINFANGGVNLDLSAITGGSGDCGGNGMSGGGTLTLTTADDWYWQTTDAGTYNFSDATYWFTATNGGGDSGDVRGFPPLPQDNCYFDADSITGATTVDQDMPRMCKTLDFTGVDAMAFHVNNISQTIFGSWITVPNVTLTSATSYSLSYEGRGNFTTNVSWNAGHSINMIGGTLTLIGNISTVNNQLTLNYGTFDANDYNVTCVRFHSSNSNIRTLWMGAGIWTMRDSGALILWNMATITNLTNPTTLGETSTIILGESASTNSQDFSGGGCVYNNVTVTNATTGVMTFNNSNTFNAFTINAPKTVKFTAGTTTTVSSFVATGTAANPITITSVTAATHTLSDSAGINTVSYCTISYSTAQGGATWNANDGTNTDGGNNTGWNFAAAARRFFIFD